MPQARLIPGKHQPGPIKTPASLPWHEACLPCHHVSRRRQIKKVDHYWLSVDAMARPMRVCEDSLPYGSRE